MFSPRFGVDAQALSHFGREAEILMKSSRAFEGSGGCPIAAGFRQIDVREVAP